MSDDDRRVREVDADRGEDRVALTGSVFGGGAGASVTALLGLSMDWILLVTLWAGVMGGFLGILLFQLIWRQPGDP